MSVMVCVCWMRAPRRAARRVTCLNWPIWNWSRSISTARAPRGLTQIYNACGCAQRSASAMQRSPRNGGMAAASTGFCSMRPVRVQAWRASDIAQLAARQQQMLRAVWPLLNTGGELLYSTCSVFSEEGEAQARAFERAASDAVRLPAPGQLLPSVTPAEQNHDGFFYARFLKR